MNFSVLGHCDESEGLDYGCGKTASTRKALCFNRCIGGCRGHTLVCPCHGYEQRGFGAQSLKNLQPGTRVSISLKIPEDVVLFGVLMWSQHTLLNQLDAYNMGFDIPAIRHQGTLHDEPSENEDLMDDILARIEEHQRLEAGDV